MGKESHLFLIDDDDVDAMTIERALRQCRIGNPIVRAHNGIEALEMMRDGSLIPPYVTLLDLRMPQMNGLEFLGEVRADPKLSDSIIFVLTTSDDEIDINQCYKNNVAGYFLKEHTGEKLIEIAEFLKGYWRIVELPAAKKESRCP